LQCALNAVWFARISDADREAIFAANADRLLGQSGSGGDRLAKAPPPPPTALVDVHAHVGSFPVPSPQHDEIEWLQRNRQTFNIETVVASSSEAIGYNPVQGNRALATVLAEHTWLRGYVVCNPRDLLASREALETYLGKRGFVGVKVHAQYSATQTSSRPMWQQFEEIARFNRPVKIHNAGADWVNGLEAIAKAFTSLKIVIAHAGPGAPVGEAVQLAASVPNVYLEFCTTYPRRGIIRAAVDQAGAEKVLFGSDQLLIDPAYVLGAYQDADLSDSERTRVGLTNPRTVFEL
jgi:predicted TIM-barrel fold metal-dependent hydrolase